MHRFSHRFASAAVLALVVASCSEPATTVGGGGARLALVPEFSRADEGILKALSAFALEIDNVHIRVQRPGANAPLADTVVQFPANTNQIAVQLTLPLEADEETLSALLELKSADAVMFTGTQSLTVRLGVNRETTTIKVTYVGPGATAQHLQIDPPGATFFAGSVMEFVAIATDAAGAPVPDLPLSWSSSNTAVATVSEIGTVTGVAPGTASVIVHAVSGLADTVPVTVTPAPARLVVVSGDAQSATVGQGLPLPVMVQLQSTTGTGVPGIPVAFRVVSGGGGVESSTLTTDAQGRVTNYFSLGPTAGANTFEATSLSLPPLTIHATGVAGAAVSLVQVSGLGQTADAGKALPAPLVVRALDQYRNPVPSASVGWTQSTVADPGTLSAPTTVTGTDGTTSVTYTTASPGTITALLASEAGQPVNFTFAVNPGPAAQLRPVMNPVIVSCCQGPDVFPVSVRVTDAFGNAVVPPATVTVTFGTPDPAIGGFGANFLPSAIARTDATGVASTTFGFVFGSPSSQATVTASGTIGTIPANTQMTLVLLSAGNRIPASSASLSRARPGP